MTTTTDWQTRVGDVWAAEHRRTDRSLADLARHLDAAVLAAAPATGTALDIGCGAGATSATIAAARPELRITGIDLSEPLIAIAKARVRTATFHVADAATDPLPGGFDLLYSRHGVMFFADPAAAFTRLRQAANPGAPLVFSCFRDRSRNAFAAALVEQVTGEALSDPAGYARGPFAFANMEFVYDLLTRTGWTAVTAASIDFDYVAGEGEDPVADATSFLTRIGPLSRSISDADPADRDRLLARLSDALARYVLDNRVVLPASAWIWRAQAGEPS